MSHGRSSRALALALLALPALPALTACQPGGTGQLASTRTDLAPGEPLRSLAPDHAHVAACGDGEPTPEDDARFIRTPFLQQVKPDGALVVWRARGEARHRLEVTRPDGAPVATIDAVEDPGAPMKGNRQHVARLDGLEPGTLYCYRVLAEDGALTGRIGLRTAPAPDDEAPVQFAVIGDSGDGSEGQLAVIEQLGAVPFDLLLHTGDVAYESGKASELTRQFFDLYGPLIRSVPVYPTSGNHEYKTRNAAPYLSAFVLPDNGKDERWYSFDWGPIHFVALDTERMSHAQAAWLDRDLAATDRPWKIVIAHRPPYSSGKHGSSKAFRLWFEALLEKHGVQLVLNGHDHHYERVEPQDGITYVVTGGAGRELRSVDRSSFTAYAEPVHHFVHATVAGDTLTLRAIDATGVEFDRVQITR